MKTVNDPVLTTKWSVTYSYVAFSPAQLCGYSGGPARGSCAPCPYQTEKAWAAFVPSTAGYALLMGTAEKMHGRHQNHFDLTEVSSPSYKTGISISPHPIKWAT